MPILWKNPFEWVCLIFQYECTVIRELSQFSLKHTSKCKIELILVTVCTFTSFSFKFSIQEWKWQKLQISPDTLSFMEYRQLSFTRQRQLPTRKEKKFTFLTSSSLQTPPKTRRFHASCRTNSSVRCWICGNSNSNEMEGIGWRSASSGYIFHNFQDTISKERIHSTTVTCLRE